MANRNPKLSHATNPSRPALGDLRKRSAGAIGDAEAFRDVVDALFHDVAGGAGARQDRHAPEALGHVARPFGEGHGVEVTVEAGVDELAVLGAVVKVVQVDVVLRTELVSALCLHGDEPVDRVRSESPESADLVALAVHETGAGARALGLAERSLWTGVRIISLGPQKWTVSPKMWLREAYVDPDEERLSPECRVDKPMPLYKD